MSVNALLTIFTLFLFDFVMSQSSTSTSYIPLASVPAVWGELPETMCNGVCGPRGLQFGFNLCNTTTQNQNSNCQTSVINNLAKFCLWAPPEPNSNISYTEAIEVAWCTTPDLGTRVIPPGTISGAQALYGPNNAYLQIVGVFDQTKVNMNATDSGGELDDYGDDEEGNPMGGVLFSSYFGNDAASFNAELQNGTALSVANEVREIYWFVFLGNGIFCMRVCDPNTSNAANLCNHIYDEIGCDYNAPANYNEINGTFTVCDTDNDVQIGQYVVDGTTSTWTQGWTGTISVPYTASIPSSSNCYTYSSEQLWPSAVAYFDSISPSATASGMVTGFSGASASRTGAGAGASQTGATSGTIMTAGMLPYMTGGFLLTTLITIAAILA